MFRITRRLGAASLIAMVAATSGVLAQSKPNWVDPPAQAEPAAPAKEEAKEPAPAATAEPQAKPATAAPSAAETRPKSAEAPATASAPEPVEPAAATPRTRSAPVASVRSRSSTRAASLRSRRMKAREARVRSGSEKPVNIRSSRRLEVTPERAAASVPVARKIRSTGLLNLRRVKVARRARAVSRPAVAALQAPRAARRVGSVRQALQSGFQVMRVRTLEYPDGRRVTVMSQPDADTMRELVQRY